MVDVGLIAADDNLELPPEAFTHICAKWTKELFSYCWMTLYIYLQQEEI